jgi:hypothetical protein
MSKVIVLVVTLFFGDPKHTPEVTVRPFDSAAGCLAAKGAANGIEGTNGVVDVEAACFEVDNTKAAPS